MLVLILSIGLLGMSGVDKTIPFLQGGSLFKIEENIGVDGNYAMLQEYFHGTKAEEKNC